MATAQVPVSYEGDDMVWKIDPAAMGSDLSEELDHLIGSPKYGDALDPDEWERICRMAVILYHKLDRNESFDDCFHTAVIWERG